MAPASTPPAPDRRRTLCIRSEERTSPARSAAGASSYATTPRRRRPPEASKEKADSPGWSARPSPKAVTGRLDASTFMNATSEYGSRMTSVTGYAFVPTSATSDFAPFGLTTAEACDMIQPSDVRTAPEPTASLGT